LLEYYQDISKEITIRLSNKGLPMLQEFGIENLGTLRWHVLPLSKNVNQSQSKLEYDSGKFRMRYDTSLKDIGIMNHMFRDNILPLVGI
jgi:hypothetical protein